MSRVEKLKKAIASTLELEELHRKENELLFKLRISLQIEIFKAEKRDGFYCVNDAKKEVLEIDENTFKKCLDSFWFKNKNFGQASEVFKFDFSMDNRKTLKNLCE